jgi:hypothetical protein
VPGESRATVCPNCDAPTRRVCRFVTLAAAGRRLSLSVCRPCYLQLDDARRKGFASAPPPRAAGGERP